MDGGGVARGVDARSTKGDVGRDCDYQRVLTVLLWSRAEQSRVAEERLLASVARGVDDRRAKWSL